MDPLYQNLSNFARGSLRTETMMMRGFLSLATVPAARDIDMLALVICNADMNSADRSSSNRSSAFIINSSSSRSIIITKSNSMFSKSRHSHHHRRMLTSRDQATAILTLSLRRGHQNECSYYSDNINICLFFSIIF